MNLKKLIIEGNQDEVDKIADIADNHELDYKRVSLDSNNWFIEVETKQNEQRLSGLLKSIDCRMETNFTSQSIKSLDIQ